MQCIQELTGRSEVAETPWSAWSPLCPSCAQIMVHAPGYFHCPRCHFGIREDWEVAEGTGFRQHCG